MPHIDSVNDTRKNDHHSHDFDFTILIFLLRQAQTYKHLEAWEMTFQSTLIMIHWVISFASSIRIEIDTYTRSSAEQRRTVMRGDWLKSNVIKNVRIYTTVIFLYCYYYWLSGKREEINNKKRERWVWSSWRSSSSVRFFALHPSISLTWSSYKMNMWKKVKRYAR